MNNSATRLLACVLLWRMRKIIARRSPNLAIGRSGSGGVYMRRWYLIPRNETFNIYLHLFFRDDPDVHHDHPWPSWSLLLDGHLLEATPESNSWNRESMRKIVPGDLIKRAPEHAHHLIVGRRGTVTIFITGPKVREWGFLCPQGWRHWEEFVKPGDSGQIGRGCAE